MAVTIFVNMRSVAHTSAGGKAVCMSPDVCKTPAAPSPITVPYPNIAQDSDGAEGSTTVKGDGSPILLKNSKFSLSSGDEAGSLGGVISSKFKGIAKFATYSFDVKVEGQNVCRHLDMTLMNGNGFNDNGTYTFASGMTIPMEGQPTKKECQTAIKLLGDFESRLKAKIKNPKQAANAIAKLKALGGRITMLDVMFVEPVFPAVFKNLGGRLRQPGLTKNQIEEICGG